MENSWTVSPDDPDYPVFIAIHAAGFGEDVLCAYLAETRPLHPLAPRWRRRSGTRNGVNVSCFLHAIPTDSAWAELPFRLMPDIEARTPRQRVFIAWLLGRLANLPALFEGQPRFQGTVERLVLTPPPVEIW